jgi:hypothetical protein
MSSILLYIREEREKEREEGKDIDTRRKIEQNRTKYLY